MPLGANKAAIMGVAGVSTADVVLLTTTTISADANVAFTSELTSAYNEYIFGFYNIHPATDGAHWTFNGSDDTSSHSYDIVKTTTNFRAFHSEADATPGVAYHATDDLAQGTGYATIYTNVDNDADSSCSGQLHLFNPSSTTYVTHFYSRIQGVHQDTTSREVYIGGYFNATAAITAVDFKFSSGNADAGKIKVWGVK
jgi:hypothetical protein